MFFVARVFCIAPVIGAIGGVFGLSLVYLTSLVYLVSLVNLVSVVPRKDKGASEVSHVNERNLCAAAWR